MVLGGGIRETASTTKLLYSRELKMRDHAKEPV